MIKRVRYERPHELVAWAEAVLHLTFRDDVAAIGLERDAQLCAVVAYDTFTSTGVNVHVAAEPGRRWMTREFIQHAVAYPFLTCRFRRLTCIIPAGNVDSIRLAEHFGCQLEGRLREASDDGSDELIYGLLRRDCAWLPKTITPRLAFAR